MENDLNEWFVDSKPIFPDTTFRKNKEFLKRAERELNDRLEKNGRVTNLDLEECLGVDVGPWVYVAEQSEYKPDKCPCCGQPWPKDSD